MTGSSSPLATVIAPGMLTLIEDLGRGLGDLPTGAAIGLPSGGAMDRGALRLANRLVGNPEEAAGLEVLLGGVVLRFDTRAVVAVTGAPVEVWIDERVQPHHRPLVVESGSTLRLGRAVTGLRMVVAIASGVAGEMLAGSVSASPAAGLGRAPLVAGDRLSSARLPVEPAMAADVAESAAGGGGVTLRLVPGPRDDWLSDHAHAVIAQTGWRVTADCDRVGIRLTGPMLQRRRTDELASEAVVRGAVQVPPSGQPVIFGADHPTTGGYPVIGVVAEPDLDLLGQVRPGDEVRFSWLARPRWQG